MNFIKKFLQDNWFPISVFSIWRILLLVVSVLSFKFLTFKASFPFIDENLISSGFPQWIWQWGNFDGVHYLAVAQHGYTGLINNEQAFFPLYPLLISILNKPIGNFFLSAFLISNLCFLGAMIALYKLVKKMYSVHVARWSILFLVCFPTSFFFGSIYTESLFLFLLLVTFLCLNSRKYFLSFTFGLLSGLTRLIGFFVFGGLAGFIIYSSYLWITFGKPLYFLEVQNGFKAERSSSLTSLISPPQVMFRYSKIFISADRSHPDYWIAVTEFSSFVLGVLVLGWLTYRKKIPAAYLIYSWPALVLPSLTGTFSSMPRYLLTIFPIFIGLGMIKSQALKIVFLSLSSVLMVVLTILFLRGYWIS